MDWKILTTDGLECQHIYIHQLQPGDTLQAIATKHRKSHTVAIILVNADDTLSLPPVYSEGIAHKSKKNNLPMILISAEDGAHLKELLNQYDTGELHAKIESKNQSHVELKSHATPAGGMAEPTPGKPKPLKPSEMGRPVCLKYVGKGKVEY